MRDINSSTDAVLEYIDYDYDEEQVSRNIGRISLEASVQEKINNFKKMHIYK